MLDKQPVRPLASESEPGCFLPGEREKYQAALESKRNALESELAAEKGVHAATGLAHQRYPDEVSQDLEETHIAIERCKATRDCAP